MRADILVINDKNRKFFEPYIPDATILNEKRLIPMGAAVEGCPVGVCLISLDEDDIAELRWIYVVKEYRRQGIARAMFDEYTAFAQKKGLLSLVLSYDPVNSVEFEKEGLQFLENMGFFVSRHTCNHAISIETIMANKRLATLNVRSTKVNCVSEMETRDRAELKEFLRARGFSSDILDNREICLEASFVNRGGAGTIESCLLSSKRGRALGLDILISDGGAEASILSLIKYLYLYIGQHESKVDRLYLTAMNPKIESLLVYIFGNEIEKGWEYYYGATFIE